MPTSIANLRRRESEQYFSPPLSVAVFEPIPSPSSVAVEGKAGGFIITWSPVAGAEDYRVAVMNNFNLAKPNCGIFSAGGGASNRFLYLVANVVRQFAVCAVRAGQQGPWSIMYQGTSSAGSFASDTVTAPSAPAVVAPQTDNEGYSDYGWSSGNDD